eukprot:Selendium_serpulae@DN2942_c1_g1_i1.p1
MVCLFRAAVAMGVVVFLVDPAPWGVSAARPSRPIGFLGAAFPAEKAPKPMCGGNPNVPPYLGKWNELGTFTLLNLELNYGMYFEGEANHLKSQNFGVMTYGMKTTNEMKKFEVSQSLSGWIKQFDPLTQWMNVKQTELTDRCGGRSVSQSVVGTEKLIYD